VKARSRRGEHGPQKLEPQLKLAAAEHDAEPGKADSTDDKDELDELVTLE
jgi:hypothetical protein